MASPLSGGRGTAWRAGAVVLKPLDMPAAALRWQADVLSGLAVDGIRLAPPQRSRSGELVVDGWWATPWLAGRHLPRWAQIIAAGERLAAALAAVPRPDELLEARVDHWARADRIAWGDAPPGELAPVAGVARLLDARRPLALPAQLIHGDLSGNVLLDAARPPAIIDVSPYWRPAAYQSAIVVVDAIASHGAGIALATPMLSSRDGVQLLIRAALFRLLSDDDPAAGRYDVLVDAVAG